MGLFMFWHTANSQGCLGASLQTEYSWSKCRYVLFPHLMGRSSSLRVLTVTVTVMQRQSGTFFSVLFAGVLLLLWWGVKWTSHDINQLHSSRILKLARQNFFCTNSYVKAVLHLPAIVFAWKVQPTCGCRLTPISAGLGWDKFIPL